MNKKEWLRSLKFLAFSVSAGVIQLGSFALLDALFFHGNGAYQWIPYLISLVLSVIWNFTFNRRYTFKSDGNIRRAMLLVALYYCVFTPLSTWFEGYLTGTLGWIGILATALNMIINFVTEFLFQRFVVYRNNIDTNKLAKEKLPEE